MSFTTYLRQTPALNRCLWVFGLLYVVSQGLIAWILGDGGPRLLALQTTFTQAGLDTLVADWTGEDIERFRAHFHLDLVHPIWYGLFCAAWLAKLLNLNELPDRYNGLIWLPLVAAFCDMVENAIHAPFALGLSTLGQPYIAVAASFATAKWTLALVFVTAIVVLQVRYSRTRCEKT